MIQIVRGHDLVLDALIVELDCVVSIIAAEDKKIFDCELLSLRPSDLETSSLLRVITALEGLRIQQVKDFLVIDLQKACVDVDRLGSLCRLSLFEHLSDGANRETVLSDAATDLDFASALLTFLLLVLVALHCVGLARTGLPVSEYCCMEALDDLADEPAYLQLLEHVCLAILGVDDLVEFEILLSFALTSCVLVDAEMMRREVTGQIEGGMC